MNAAPLPALPDPRLRRGAAACLLALIALCLLWETAAAPLRPGGSMWVLKVLPLLAPLPGILRGRLYTFQWASMLILLYLMEGVVRGMTEHGMAAVMAWMAAALALAFFVCAVLYVRPAKRLARQAARSGAEKTP
jgi:uncharacterized membrane protein